MSLEMCGYQTENEASAGHFTIPRIPYSLNTSSLICLGMAILLSKSNKIVDDGEMFSVSPILFDEW